MKKHRFSTNHNWVKSVGLFLIFATLLTAPATYSPVYANHSFGGILNLSNSNGIDSITPKVAASGSDVYVLWQEGADVFFADSEDTGTSFGATTNLSGSGSASTPQIAASGNNVYTIWKDGTEVLFLKSADNGDTFPGPIIDLNGASAFVLTPQIVASGNNVYAIWSDLMGQVDIYFINSTDSGDTFPDSPINLSNSVASSSEGQIVTSGNNVYVVWRESNDIFFIQSTDNGDTFPNLPINLSNSGGGPSASRVPQIAADGSNVYVIWKEGTNVLFTKSTDSGASFSVPLDIGDAASSATPQIAIVGTNVYTVWRDDTTGNGDIRFRASTDGGITFSPDLASPALNLSNNGGESTSAVIAASGNEVYVVWADNTPTNFEILSRVSHDNGDTFDNSIRITNNAGKSLTPQIAVDSGNLFVVWDDETPDPALVGDILFSVGAPAAISVTFDQSTEYRIGQIATVTVTDIASNLDDMVIETIVANIISTTDGVGITLTLTETGPASGMFSNMLELSATGSVNEISIKVAAGDIVSASFGGETANVSVFPITIDYLFMGLKVAVFDYGHIANILVENQNANLDSGVAETITASITSTTDPVGITLDLVETGPNTGKFGDAGSQLIFSENNQPFPTSGTLTVSHENNPANLDPLVIDTTTVNVVSTSDPVGITLTVKETDVNSSIFSGKLTLTTGPSVPNSSIKVTGGDILTVSSALDDSNSLIAPNPNPSLGAIQVDFQNPDTVTVTYEGKIALASVSDLGGGGGGGGGIIRPGLVLDVLAGISFFGGGGGSKGPKAPTVSSSSFSFEPEPGLTQLGEEEFGGVISKKILLDDSSQTQIVQTGKDIEFSFDVYENGGKGNLEHVALYLNMRGQKVTHSQSDTYIIYEWNKPLEIVDPNELFSDVSFEILEKDTFNLILKYEIKFAKQMEKSHMLLRAWDFDRWNTDVIHKNIIEVVNGGKEIPSLDESEIFKDTTITSKKFIDKQENSLDKVREKLHSSNKIPAWVKTSAGWWSEKKVSDSDFISGIEFLIQNDIITTPSTEKNKRLTQNIPHWISINAGWWSKEMVSDDEFIAALQWLIENGVMKI